MIMVPDEPEARVSVTMKDAFFPVRDILQKLRVGHFPTPAFNRAFVLIYLMSNPLPFFSCHGSWIHWMFHIG
jgi:hypothetical protein